MRISAVWLLCSIAGTASAKPTVQKAQQVQQATKYPSYLLPCIVVQRGSTYGGAQDASLFPGYPTSTDGNLDAINVSGFIGSPGQGSGAKALLKFTIGANTVPKGDSITYAEIVLNELDAPRYGAISASLLTKDWDESTVTPNNYPVGSLTGALIHTTPLDSAIVRIDVTQQVIDWVGGAPNYGVVLAAVGLSTPINPLSVAFTSSDAANHRPYLRICLAHTPCKVEGAACTDPHRCTINGTCKSGVCTGQPATAGTVCRPAFSACDVQEVCDGSSTTCPAAGIAASTVECRAVTGACDVAEKCTGAAAECPTDAFQPSGTSCRPAAGNCDVAEVCTGTAAACPKDAFKAASHVCRGSSGDCDPEEKCTGSSATCPADKLTPAATPCRPAAGACDVAESCTGSSPACPGNAFKPASASCRASAGPCDVAESCTGSSAACPADAKAPNGKNCGGTMICSGGACVQCGTAGAVCCPGNHCNNASDVCSGGICKACGIQVGAPCCPGSKCNAGMLCGTNGTCFACGGYLQGCCTSGNPCAATAQQALFCTATPGTGLAKCDKCANLHQHCCPANIGLPICVGNLACDGNNDCETPSQ